MLHVRLAVIKSAEAVTIGIVTGLSFRFPCVLSVRTSSLMKMVLCLPAHYDVCMHSPVRLHLCVRCLLPDLGDPSILPWHLGDKLRLIVAHERVDLSACKCVNVRSELT